MTTTATQEGRKLALRVDGIPEPFIIDPISARRGKQLTDHFLTLIVGSARGQKYSPAEQETVFIESVGPTVWARMLNVYIDEFDDEGTYVRSFDDQGETIPRLMPPAAPPTLGGIPIRYTSRDPLANERELDNEPIRQEEGDELALLAFYWQTIVGMEAVQAYLADGGGAAGSLKALALLRIRLGSSASTSSSQAVLGSLTQQGSSSETTATATSSASVRLPANKRGFLQNPTKTRRRR